MKTKVVEHPTNKGWFVVVAEAYRVSALADSEEYRNEPSLMPIPIVIVPSGLGRSPEEAEELADRLVQLLESELAFDEEDR